MKSEHERLIKQGLVKKNSKPLRDQLRRIVYKKEDGIMKEIAINIVSYDIENNNIKDLGVDISKEYESNKIPKDSWTTITQNSLSGLTFTAVMSHINEDILHPEKGRSNDNRWILAFSNANYSVYVDRHSITRDKKGNIQCWLRQELSEEHMKAEHERLIKKNL